MSPGNLFPQVNEKPEAGKASPTWTKGKIPQKYPQGTNSLKNTWSLFSPQVFRNSLRNHKCLHSDQPSFLKGLER